MPSRFVKMAFEADNSFILFECFKYSSNIKCIVNNKIERHVTSVNRLLLVQGKVAQNFIKQLIVKPL